VLALENKELAEADHAEIGMIVEIEPDGRLCQVKWQAGDEEWCCTGFSGKYYLQVSPLFSSRGVCW